MAEQIKEKRKAFRLEIITPERLVLGEDIEAAVLPAAGGLVGILYNHAPFLGGLRIGVIKYRQEGKFYWVACSEGVFEVRENRLRVLCDTAERGEDIDVLRAQQAKARSLKRLREKQADLDYLRAEMALRRALARLKAAAGATKDPS